MSSYPLSSHLSAPFFDIDDMRVQRVGMVIQTSLVVSMIWYLVAAHVGSGSPREIELTSTEEVETKPNVSI